MSVRDQYEDWKYLVSKNNTTSRKFYLANSIMIVAMFIVTLVAFVAACLGKVHGFWQTTSFIAFPVAVVLIIVVIIVLVKQD